MYGLAVPPLPICVQILPRRLLAETNAFWRVMTSRIGKFEFEYEKDHRARPPSERTLLGCQQRVSAHRYPGMAFVPEIDVWDMLHVRPVCDLCVTCM